MARHAKSWELGVAIQVADGLMIVAGDADGILFEGGEEDRFRENGL